MCRYQTTSRKLVLALGAHAPVAAKTHLPPLPPPVTAHRASATGKKQPCRSGLLHTLDLGSLVLHPCHLTSTALGSHLRLLGLALARGIEQGVGRMQRPALHRDSAVADPRANLRRRLSRRGNGLSCHEARLNACACPSGRYAEVVLCAGKNQLGVKRPEPCRLESRRHDTGGEGASLGVVFRREQRVPGALASHDGIKHILLIGNAQKTMKHSERLGIERLQEVRSVGHEEEEEQPSRERLLQRVGPHMGRALVTKEQQGKTRIARLPFVCHQVHIVRKQVRVQGASVCPEKLAWPRPAGDPSGPFKRKVDV